MKGLDPAAKTAAVAVVVVMYLFLSCSSALAQSAEEKNFLSMYFNEEDLIVQTATRSPQPLSQVAENMTVVTAADIELMNAHTLADVLNTITGVQVCMTGGPGQMAFGYIQGSEQRHVTVFIDGVPLNNLGADNVELGMIPVQNIEKLEIIKGPASSAWGSALGGVVNIITKSGSMDTQGAMLSASYGTKNTGDFRAEARGKRGRFGYYVTAGRLQSDGLTPHMDLSAYNAYMKFAYGLMDNTNILFTFGYENNTRNTGEWTAYDSFFNNTWKTLHSTLAVTSMVSKNMDVDVSIRSIRHEYNYDGSGVLAEKQNNKDYGYGASAKLIWRKTAHTIVAGTDYDDRWLNSNRIAGGEHGIRKWAVFLNDTLSFNKASITPGIRYEKTNTNGDITNPSLGITYSLSNSTIFRVYSAKGFNIPSLGATFGDTVDLTPNPYLEMEKVTSYQAGVETAALKYLWTKVSVFKNKIHDALKSDPTSTTTFTYVNQLRQTRQGIEIEVKTIPVYNFSFSAGWEYIDAKKLDTGSRLVDIPTHVYDMGIHYDDESTFKALLKGRYIDWNAHPSNGGSYGSPVFDLSIIKKIYQHTDKSSLEAFGNIHNIFNGSQYVMSLYKNPKRWLEVGVRYAF